MALANFTTASFLAGLMMVGATASSSAMSKAIKGYGKPDASLRVCSGYSCVLEGRFTLSAAQQARLVEIMQAGAASPAAEREAVAKVVATMETYARGSLRYRADLPKANPRYNGMRGQMDCVDESLNTTTYLTYLHSLGWLRHHRPRKHYAERGFIIDGRYPHKSAVMIDAAGRQWAVDSWYKSDGKPPAIKPLRQWAREGWGGT